MQEFLDSLPSKVGQKVVWVLKLIQDLDTVPATYFKKLEGTNDIWECRVQFASNICRLLGFPVEKGTLVLTHGFIKKSQKTPKNEIERAEMSKKDYIRRLKP